jgi:hypothetical protein
LVTTLTLTGVMEAAIILPVVDVAVLFTADGVSEQEHVWRGRRRANTTLSTTTEQVVKLLSFDVLARS